MSISGVTENVVEETTLQLFAELDYEYAYGPDLAPDEPAEERASYSDVILRGRLEEALRRLSPTATPVAIDEPARRSSSTTPSSRSTTPSRQTTPPWPCLAMPCSPRSLAT